MFAWANSFTDNIKNHIFAYLLQRYMGNFFQDKLSTAQLTVDLSSGTGTLEKIGLDVQALNELGKEQNWPVEFVDGYIERVNITVPYTAPLTQSSSVELDGVIITVQPKQRPENVTSMLGSLWSSMTSSMQLAEECAKQEQLKEKQNVNLATTYEGIQACAHAIDTILSKVKLRVKNFTLQVEHVPQFSSTGVGVVVHIEDMQYSDESANDPTTEEATDMTNQDKSKTYLVQSYTSKRISIVGVSFSTVEFSRDYRTFSPSVMTNSQFLNSDGLHRHEILFGRLSSTQEIRIKLKQSEQMQGPKVSIETNLGSLLLYLSPRQVHVLLEVAHGLACPDLEDTSNVAIPTKVKEKPMSTSDYQKIEQELQQNMQNNQNIQATGLHGVHGWSTAPLDDSDPEDNYLPIQNTNAGMVDSTLSGHSSSMDSSYNSSMASSMTEHTQRSRKRSSNIDTDPRTEVSHFQVRLASMAMIVIHEDLLIQSSDDQVLLLSTVNQMKKITEDFFFNLKDFTLTAFGARQLEDAGKLLDAACKFNHLRLLATPIQLEGDEKTTLSAFSVNAILTVAKLELLEVLCETDGSLVQHVPLLIFKQSTTKANNITAKPHLTLNFKHTDKTVTNSLSCRNSGRKTDIKINLEKCIVEVDLTIFDRISALLNPQPICLIDNARNPWTVPANEIIGHQVDSTLNLKVNSESVCIRLRFPVADYRPLNDMNRVAWFKRNVRPDFLSITLSNVLLQTNFQTTQNYQEYDLTTQGLNIYYFETENSRPVHVAKSGGDENFASINDLTKSRLNIKIYPMQKLELDELNKPEQDINTHSMCAYFQNQNKLSAPFSSVKVVHESDTPHPKTQKDDAEDLVIPGDSEEINEFIKEALTSSQIVVDISLPTLSMQLIDKHTYELIYNRINNDLLMWKPSAPQPKTKLYEKSFPSMSSNLYDTQEVFKMCKSGIQYDSDSDSSESDEAPSIFYSTCESKIGRSSMKSMYHHPLQPQVKNQNAFTLNLHINQGLLYMNTPVRDSAAKVIPGQHGEFLLNVENANVFVVSGYNGDENLGYVCVQVQEAKLHHCDMISTASTSPPIKEIGTIPGRHLHPTIYKSDAGMMVDAKSRGGQREMLTVAVRIMASHETHHVKTVLVAIGLNKATLNHKMCNEPNSFISHIIDFFNVQDYPIPGYVSKDVITEFHLHLWDCAIDYRPLHIPLRAALTVGNFTMSSHLSAAANTSTLIFIAEECGLYLSDKAPPKNGVPSMVPVDLKRDYVNVVELGLFELSLKTSDKKNTVNPHFDLRASNNKLNIRTCSDSAKALMQLIKYYASNGDLTSISESCVSESSSVSSPRHTAEPELVSLEPQHISNLSTSQHDNVKELLGDALIESEMKKEGEDEPITNGTKIFFFPDEKQQNELTGKPLPQVTYELGDTSRVKKAGSDTDDEFCIIGEEPGLGIFPAKGHPQINWLSSDSVRVIDNHFALPTGKTDLLKAPKHFPNPIERYTLCEMTITWNMYGGHDFHTADNPKKKVVNFKDTIEKVAFQNSKTEEPVIKSIPVKKKCTIPWIIRGGAHRDHSVKMELHLNKVRFQHEVYPEHTKQASRQVLIISDVEVRDRLESSQINKFLYQYTCQAKPKQSHAHMLVIKAVHERQDQQLKAQECCLKISLLPLRLNIDQDSLLFLITFFTELADSDTPKDETTPSKHNTPTHQPPVMMVTEEIKDTDSMEEHFFNQEENFLIQLEEQDNVDKQEDSAPPAMSAVDDSTPVYFRKVTFSPDVPIRLDYQGKYVDMSRGPLAGILMGLGQLNKSELRLKRIDYRHGLLGFDKLVAHLLQEWLTEIKKNQVHSILTGVGPMHSLVQLFQGIKDLFWLPIEQYQKDGRIVRGLQRGANSFTTSTAMAALELTSRIIHLIQITAETAYDMLSPGPSIRRLHLKSKGKRKRYNQPQDIREGMTNAIMVVKEGIAHTAGDIVQVASHEHEQKGYSGAVGSVLRQIPPTMLKPIILATEATNNLLEGARSQLEPDARKEAFQKWRSNDAL